mgnify:CR=1 FL=1
MAKAGSSRPEIRNRPASARPASAGASSSDSRAIAAGIAASATVSPAAIACPPPFSISASAENAPSGEA